MWINISTKKIENEKLQTLSREIGWSHNVVIFQKCNMTNS